MHLILKQVANTIITCVQYTHDDMIYNDAIYSNNVISSMVYSERDLR